MRPYFKATNCLQGGFGYSFSMHQRYPVRVQECGQTFRRNTTLLANDVEPITVPHIIHQSWRTKKLENFQKGWQQSWFEKHPHWTYMFWTDVDNRKLVARHYPWFLEIYDAFPRNIQRADCARYFYMLHYGGCYFDLDIESIRSLDSLLQNTQVALAYMTADLECDIAIPNAFLASIPGHSFWLHVLKHIMTTFSAGDVDKGDAHRVTGPVMLRKAVLEYQRLSPVHDLTIFPSKTIYGVDFTWRNDPKMKHIFSVCHAASKTFNATHCKTFFPDAYAVTYWSGDITWMV